MKKFWGSEKEWLENICENVLAKSYYSTRVFIDTGSNASQQFETIRLSEKPFMLDTLSWDHCFM